jgi:general secretion pathway protein L
VKYTFSEMFFPKSVGLSIHENDLVISKSSQKFLKCAFESMVVKDFLLRDSLDLKLIIDAQGYQSGEIVLSWPREKSIVREIELPGSSFNELKESISYQLDSFILFSEDDVYYDIYPSKSSEHGEKAFIFAVKKEELDGLISKLESLNISPSRIVISPLSFIPLVNSERVIIIDKYEDFYTFNSYTDSVLVNTSLIKNEDVLNDKIIESKPDKVILLDKEYGNVTDYGKDDVKTELWERDKESLGAAINGISEHLKGFNVLKVKKTKKVISQSILIGILSSLIIAFAFVIPAIIKHKKVLTINAIDAKIQELEPDATMASKLKDETDGLLATFSKLKEIINYDKPRIDILTKLTTALPDDTWIKQLSFERDYFEIEGIGLSAANVLTLLENSPAFIQVKLTTSVLKDRDGKERFKIKGNIK